VPSGRRVAVVTGCSSGFGLEGSVALAKKGFRVFATMRNLVKRDALDRAAAAAGVSVEVLHLDVTVEDSVASTVQEVRERAGAIDVLVSNAGYGIGGFVEDLTLQEIRDQFETNFFGAVQVTKAVLSEMRERRTGRIILISSIGVFNPAPGLSAYNASKSALEAFGQALRYEVLPYGVSVSLVEPGTYATDIFFKNRHMAARSQDPASPYYETAQKLERIVMKQVERRKKADPAEVGELIARVASSRRPKVRYLVGSDARLTKIVRTLLPERATEAAISRLQRSAPVSSRPREETE
jgi:NAD(P)-dependent dehydrogenase (short-subunit alcohol dehydrogenase family)